MASILDQLDRLGDEHPHKLLYSYLDLSGDSLESYSYASFLQRTKAIAGHLREKGRFVAEDRFLLAYPPGLEMICAFFGCVRAGLIPVPVYPPSSRGFQSALYKMVHIARDCQAAGILTSRDYHASLRTNLARSGVSASGVDVDYISGLPWIVTEDFVDTISNEPFIDTSKILFLQYTSGSTMEPKGVMVTHENITQTCPLVIDHPNPVVVSWLPQYHDMGLIDGLHSAPGPVVRRHNHPSGHRDGCPQLRLRLLPARREAFQGESGEFRSQFAPGVDGRGGARKARHLHTVS
jgi:acyl-CoA synthetase (AMP-forming)/AMP-acid ligase II